jgi:PleD family two-component response regulator
MRILIAEDDAVSRRLLEAKLAKWGYEVVVTCDGGESMDIPDGMIPVTISLGVASNGSGRKRDVEALVQAADQALYRAKHNGRNRVEKAPDGGEANG